MGGLRKLLSLERKHREKDRNPVRAPRKKTKENTHQQKGLVHNLFGKTRKKRDAQQTQGVREG